MNEPQSISAEIMTLCLLGGMDNAGNPRIEPKHFIHYPMSNTTDLPISTATGRDLFYFTVPKNYSMIVTYISAYTSASDTSSLAINYGSFFNFELQIRTLFRELGTTEIGRYENYKTKFTGSFDMYLNRPVIMVFEPQQTIWFYLNRSEATFTLDTVQMSAQLNAYLIPSGYSSLFKNNESQFIPGVRYDV